MEKKRARREEKVRPEFTPNVPMKKINVRNLGQLKEANIEFGDFTVFVGQQASGKSILLQLIKLTQDLGAIGFTLQQYGYDWGNELGNFLNLYFGEGLNNIWSENTIVSVNNFAFDLPKKLADSSWQGDTPTNVVGRFPETVFLIPAHRVITLADDWPRPFSSYKIGDPYVLKQFSEYIRNQMDQMYRAESSEVDALQLGEYLYAPIYHAIQKSIFGSGTVRVDKSGLRRRIVLDVAGTQLPYLVWSTGQRESLPLLASLSILTSQAKIFNLSPDWAIIEEPEIGLHPEAISALLLVFLELLQLGKKVIISTHSPQILEMLWAIRMLKESNADPGTILKLFGVEPNQFPPDFAKSIFEKEFRSYYFERKQNAVTVKDITTLDPEDEDEAINEWGGLTSFAARASEIVSKAVREAQ